MNNRETAQIMTILQSVYPDSFKAQSGELLQATVKVWATVFRDDAYEAVQAAVLAHISGSTDKFMPPPGVIKQRIISMTTDGAEMTAQEAWQLIDHATQRGIHHAQEEFDKLPPVVKRLVGSPNQIREWAMMDAETVQSVVASNFQRSYAVRAEKEREYMALPSAVKNVIASISSEMSMTLLPGAKM